MQNIPDIRSKEELLEKYEIHIKEELKQRIINPDNWNVMGLRGIMLDNGSTLYLPLRPKMNMNFRFCVLVR